MLKVALTGSIATGKSYVVGRLRRCGIPCLDADTLAHGAMAPGTEASAAIAAHFGDVLTPDGGVDRAKLGPIVFADPAARRTLEAIVHPAVYRAIAMGLRAFELTERPPFAVADIPLLFESGHEGAFDRIVATVCSESPQRRRLRECGLTDREIDQPLAAQWPAAEKASRAHIVILTDGTFEETDAQVDAAIQALAAARRPDSDLDFGGVLRRRDAFLDERVPVVAVRALPEELRAAIPAAQADVGIQVEDGVLRHLAVPVAAERAGKAVQEKLHRLDEAFLFERSIDIDTYDRHAEKLRQELTLLRMDRHSSELDELDVEGILAFAERVLPRAADLWVQASLEQRQRFQQLFFPDGITFDGNGVVRTAITAPAFNYLRGIETGNEGWWT